MVLSARHTRAEPAKSAVPDAACNDSTLCQPPQELERKASIWFFAPEAAVGTKSTEHAGVLALSDAAHGRRVFVQNLTEVAISRKVNLEDRLGLRSKNPEARSVLDPDLYESPRQHDQDLLEVATNIGNPEGLDTHEENKAFLRVVPKLGVRKEVHLQGVASQTLPRGNEPARQRTQHLLNDRPEVDLLTAVRHEGPRLLPAAVQ